MCFFHRLFVIRQIRLRVVCKPQVASNRYMCCPWSVGRVGRHIGRHVGRRFGRCFGRRVGRRFGRRVGRRVGRRFGRRVVCLVRLGDCCGIQCGVCLQGLFGRVHRCICEGLLCSVHGRFCAALLRCRVHRGVRSRVSGRVRLNLGIPGLHGSNGPVAAWIST